MQIWLKEPQAKILGVRVPKFKNKSFACKLLRGLMPEGAPGAKYWGIGFPKFKIRNFACDLLRRLMTGLAPGLKYLGLGPHKVVGGYTDCSVRCSLLFTTGSA